MEILSLMERLVEDRRKKLAAGVAEEYPNAGPLFTHLLEAVNYATGGAAVQAGQPEQKPTLKTPLTISGLGQIAQSAAQLPPVANSSSLLGKILKIGFSQRR